MAAFLFVLPFAGALTVLVAAGFRRTLAAPVGLATLAAETALAVEAFRHALEKGALRVRFGGWPAPIGIEWSLEPLGAAMAILVAAAAFLGLSASQPNLRDEENRSQGSFWACVLLLVGGLMGMLATADLFNFFVHLEIASLAAYALTATGGPGAPRAALRYLIAGSLGASLYLLGVGHLYAATGSLSVPDVAARLAAEADPRLSALGGAFLIAGLAVKMGLFPLHAWMPEAYARCSAPAAALMAPLVTKVAAFSLLRLLTALYGADLGGGPAFYATALKGLGAAAVVVGVIGAARDPELRRVFAYSSVAQTGLVALGLGHGSRWALVGALLQIAADAAAKLALFASSAVAVRRFGVRRVEDLPAVRGRMPWTSAAIAVALLSLVGLPPLPGFFSKWYLLRAAVETGDMLLGAALAASTLGAIVYAFRLLERLYLVAPSQEAGQREGPSSVVVATSVMAAATVALGLMCGPLAALAIRTASGGGP
jgi:multicomponent Na+:H+ antiporter subunit D